MERPAKHPREAARLEALEKAQLLDSGVEQAFDDLTLVASTICETPIALVTLVDAERQWFKSNRGLDVPETSRDVSFCGHAILNEDQLLVVEDATVDPRFADNPLVLDSPEIRFYAGAPIFGPDKLPFGTLCVIDRVPRTLTDSQREALLALGRRVDAQFELRANSKALAEALGTLEFISGVLPACSSCKKVREGEGWISPDEYISKNFDVMVSHGVCPSCIKKLYSEYVDG